MPHIGGCEGAGIIEKIGSQVTNVKVGDEVIISPGQLVSIVKIAEWVRRVL